MRQTVATLAQSPTGASVTVSKVSAQGVVCVRERETETVGERQRQRERQETERQRQGERQREKEKQQKRRSGGRRLRPRFYLISISRPTGSKVPPPPADQKATPTVPVVKALDLRCPFQVNSRGTEVLEESASCPPPCDLPGGAPTTKTGPQGSSSKVLLAWTFHPPDSRPAANHIPRCLRSFTHFNRGGAGPEPPEPPSGTDTAAT